MKATARALAVLLAVAAGPARALPDSRDPSEAPALVPLGPVVLEGGEARPAGVALRVLPTRRALVVEAAFDLAGAPGPHAVSLDGPEAGLQATVDGQPVPLDRIAPCAPLQIAPRGIDPSTGEAYDLAPGPVGECEHRRAVVTLGPSGRARLVLSTELSPGFDRFRRGRTSPEIAHFHARRVDAFVYHWALLGPGGPVELALPRATEGTWRRDGDVLRVAVTETPPFPVGATVELGLAAHDDGTQLAARATLDWLLSWGDTLALGVDGTTRPRASVALTYRLQTRWRPTVPFAADVEAGPVLDVTPSVRVGGRIGGGASFAWIHTAILADIMSDADWRISVLFGVGL